jgi:hypothetical protein
LRRRRLWLWCCGGRRNRDSRFGAGAARGFGLDLANGFLESQPLARDVAFVQRRHDTAQLRNQSGARALIKSTASLAGIPFETGDGTGDERVIIGHLR